MVTLIERTKKYATEVAEAALNAFEVQVRGDLEAPGGDENVKLFTAKGGSAVTLASDTTSAVIVYDPEASLRSGQLSIMVHERSNATTVTKVSAVNLGRSTNEFISAGILSSGLKVFNSSGVDVIGGTQSQAVLTALPRDVSLMSTTDLANFCGNHERDLVSGVVSREDSTTSMVLTDHFGKKMSLSRSNMLGNLVKRTWDDSLGSRRTTTGESIGNVIDVTHTVPTVEVDPATFLTTNSTLVVADTANLSEANNPLTFATYNVDVTSYMQILDVAATANEVIKVAVIGLDAGNEIVARADISDRMQVTQSGASDRFDTTHRASISSSTKPIVRVIIGFLKRNSAANASTVVERTDSIFSVSGYEETSDIAARSVHVCVLEGLNASATLNLNSYAVLTGVPDSSNVFISSGSGSPDVHDDNAVNIFLKTLTRSMPRAFTTAGHGAVSRSLTAMYGDEALTVTFKAMSFEDVHKAVKKVSSYAKKTGKSAQQIMDEVGPIMRSIGEPMSMLPGPAGNVGNAMMMGSRLASRR